jgi:VanZ family protein
MNRRLWIWGPAVLVMGAIFYASSIPDLSEIPGGVSDKVAHFTAYAALGVVMFRAFARARVSLATPRAASLAVVIASFYGATDEGHQHFVHGRTPDVNDWIADSLGAAAAVFVCWLVAHLVQRYRVQRGEV